MKFDRRDAGEEYIKSKLAEQAKKKARKEITKKAKQVMADRKAKADAKSGKTTSQGSSKNAQNGNKAASNAKKATDGKNAAKAGAKAASQGGKEAAQAGAKVGAKATQAGAKAAQTGAKAGAKAGVAAAKGAAAIAAKIAALIASLGAPAIAIISIVILIFVLPGIIASTALGTDAKGSSDPVHAGASMWTDEADRELELRGDQLHSILLWDDFVSLFGKGEFGDSGKVFKSEIAKANELNDDGTPVSEGYFSASNKLLTIVNEAFKSSLKSSTRDGLIFESKTVRDARRLAERKKNEDAFLNEALRLYPNVDTSRITQTIERDEDMNNREFLYESAYLLAASSSVGTIDDANNYLNNEVNDQPQSDENHAIKDLLDYTFFITGLDEFYIGNRPLPDLGGRTCWAPSVSAVYLYRTEREQVGTDRIYEYDEDGNIKKDNSGNDIYVDVPIYEDIPYIDVEITYSVDLISNYNELIKEYCNLSTDKGPDGLYMSGEELAALNATELLKFYYASIELGDIGLPLPSGAYSIGCRLNCSCSVHNGNHTGLDLPAARGVPVYSIADGIVTASQSGRGNDMEATGLNSYGNYVEVTHSDGGGKTRYAHLDFNLMAVGESVTKGQTIGAVGSSGRSTGNHLHFEVRDASNGILEVMNTEVGALLEENKG